MPGSRGQQRLQRKSCLRYTASPHDPSATRWCRDPQTDEAPIASTIGASMTRPADVPWGETVRRAPEPRGSRIGIQLCLDAVNRELAEKLVGQLAKWSIPLRKCQMEGISGGLGGVNVTRMRQKYERKVVLSCRCPACERRPSLRHRPPLRYRPAPCRRPRARRRAAPRREGA